MANSDHVKILEEGVVRWNQWRFLERDCDPDLSGADFHGLDLRGVILGRVNAQGANFSKTNLEGAILSSADFREAKLAEARILFARISHSDFTAANLAGARLHCSRIYQMRCTSAILTGAGFNQTRIDDVDFTGADLRKANLSESYFFNGSFDDADLSEAHLNHSTFKRMTFARTQLADAGIGGTGFEGIDLRETRGLELVRHFRSSYIDVDTIYKSKGKIPQSFLRQAGVPDSLIGYIPSLISSEEGFQFYSCFISYSHKDDQFCKRLHARMREERLRVYFAPEEMHGGKKINEQIETQIQLYDKLLLVLSEHSMKSQWVATEIYQAEHHKRKTGREFLFPIALCPYEKILEWKLFDADSGRDMAREIRTYFIQDFSDWQNDIAFEAAFARLLKSLRAVDPK
jgi:uncharacterized protein YjbI with pentapeptide repeats